jgi:hypothetical protein
VGGYKGADFPGAKNRAQCAGLAQMGFARAKRKFIDCVDIENVTCVKGAAGC